MELLSILLLILVIVAIVDLIKNSLDVNKKILWVILIICLPVLGLILYYLIGRPSASK